VTTCEDMLAEIEADTRETARWTGRRVLAPRVVSAMRAVRRAAFVEPSLAAAAYENRPLTIGHGQTISQPFIVALMTDLLEVQPEHVVLEIGTGSGYQAAVLAQLVQRVFSVEVIGALAEQARAALAAEGIGNVEVQVGDGAAGWPEHAPFDAVIVTAVAPHVPPALFSQLRAPGRMVIPLGTPKGEQQLVLVEKSVAGKLERRNVLPVAFVPLTGRGDRAHD
jgi:protein-L-isoaspartate(D-aspartate) O-methyltransferase